MATICFDFDGTLADTLSLEEEFYLPAFRERGIGIWVMEPLHGGTVPDFNDHRIPMAMAIAATMADAPVKILGAQCVAKSYPDFFEVYESLGGKLTRE